MNKCGNCYFCVDDCVVATTTDDGKDVCKSRCKLLFGKWVDREGVCEFWNERRKMEVAK